MLGSPVGMPVKSSTDITPLKTQQDEEPEIVINAENEMQKVNAVPYSRLQRKSNRDGALSKPVGRSKNLSMMNIEVEKMVS